MKTEILAQVRSDYFTAGIILVSDKVELAAPIIGFMRNWSRDRVRDYCVKKKWDVEIVRVREVEDDTGKVKRGEAG
jgi:hypothetical protein